MNILTGDPLTPDDDQARKWLQEELAKPEYGTELDPISKIIRSILEFIQDILSGSPSGGIPIEAIILIGFTIALVVIGVVIVVNPVRLRNVRGSATVFDGEEFTSDQARDELSKALQANDTNAAIVWAFRVLVLVLAEARLLRDAPGLTAHEAAAAASKEIPANAAHFSASADVFDRVRYGEEPGTPAELNALLALVKDIESVIPRTRVLSEVSA
ncbi:MAG: DUF4129 domain-containing protein [Actinomycetaceae bacterium]|nr:DUF4129 domain-containing protein [Actinomycetaceae bacterium]